MDYGLVIEFIEHFLDVTTNNYDSLTELLQNNYSTRSLLSRH
jgi:hypothetical protein